MAYVIAMLIVSTLFFGFLLLTRIEYARGRRFAEGTRTALDHQVRKIAFILSHVDWDALAHHAVREGSMTVLHKVAEGMLRIVRVSEQFLTRTVHALQARLQAPVKAGGTKNLQKQAPAVFLKHSIRSKTVPVAAEDEIL